MAIWHHGVGHSQSDEVRLQEKKNSDMINSSAELLKDSDASDACPKWMWSKFRAQYAACFELSKQQMM